MVQNEVRPFYFSDEIFRYFPPLWRILLIQKVLNSIEIALAPRALARIIHV